MCLNSIARPLPLPLPSPLDTTKTMSEEENRPHSPILEDHVADALSAQRQYLEQAFQTEIESLRRRFESELTALRAAAPPTAAAPTPTLSQPNRRIEGSPPSVFGGDRALGRTWMNQCSVYLTANTWSSQEHMIKHTLTFFKEGRALTWAVDASQYYTNHGVYPWVTFAAFKVAFLAEFSDPHDATRCISTLNHKTSWHQNTRSLDVYIDTFMDLAKRAGYVAETGVPVANWEGQVCLLFRTGLAPHIRHHCSVLRVPAPQTLAEWKAVALAFVSAKEEDDVIQELLKLQLRPAPAAPLRAPALRNAPAPVRPVSVPSLQAPAYAAMPKGHGEPMDIDAVHRRRSAAALSNIECYTCRKRGHMARDCPDRDRRIVRVLDMNGNPILDAAEQAQLEEYLNLLALEYDREDNEQRAAAPEDEPEDFGTRRM